MRIALQLGLDRNDCTVADANINNGNISVLTNWNLGSGASVDNLDFRFNGVAPIITFKAENETTRFSRKGDEFWVNTPGIDGKNADFKVAYTFGIAPLQGHNVWLHGLTAIVAGFFGFVWVAATQRREVPAH